MATNEIKLSFDKDALWIFKATRMMLCECVDCRFHQHNRRESSDRMECTLKTIYITAPGGECGYYDPREE